MLLYATAKLGPARVLGPDAAAFSSTADTVLGEEASRCVGIPGQLARDAGRALAPPLAWRLLCQLVTALRQAIIPLDLIWRCHFRPHPRLRVPGPISRSEAHRLAFVAYLLSPFLYHISILSVSRRPLQPGGLRLPNSTTP